MRPSHRLPTALLAVAVTLAAARGRAAEPDEPPPEPQQDEAAEKPKEPKVTERIVVSASATGDAALDAPAAVDVIEAETLREQPGDSIADYLRRVPGLNVAQFSARDVNVSSRSATGGINNSTLVLTDGRSLYQDFLGFVMWEFAPTDLSLVDRVEVVRGPASSLWGANAVGGVVQVFTKSPRDTLGGRLRIEGGSYHARRIEARESFLAGNWALRLSGSFYDSDAFKRPETITNVYGAKVDPDLGLIDQAPDSRTRQPRLDVRADWDGPDGDRWSLQGGWGRTAGWIATGLGPFDVDSSTSSSYAQARWTRGPLEAQVYTNFFDGRAVNLINAIPFDFTSGLTHASFRGRSLIRRRAVVGWGAELERSVYALNIAPGGKRRTRGSVFAEAEVSLVPKLWLVAGGRLDHFHETIGTVFSPKAALRFKPRDNHALRLAWGRAFRSPSVIETDLSVPEIPVAILNWEKVDLQGDVFSISPIGFFVPLAQVVCSGQPDNCGAPPGQIPDYVAVTAASGSRDLHEERTDSLELGWSAELGDFGLSVSLYRTHSRGGIDFPQVASYGVGADGQPGTTDDVILPTDPNGDAIDEAPAVDVCPYVNAIPPFNTLCPLGPVGYNHALSILLDGQIPARFQYANGATQDNRGFEVGTSWSSPKGVSVQLNYSWQDVPRSDGVSMTRRIDTLLAERSSGMDLDGDGRVGDTSAFVNIPARHRVAFGAQVDRPHWFAAVTWDYVARTFWQDVLTSDFWGYVPSYSLVGLRGGWRWPRAGVELGAQVTNLLDDPIQQHIYADIIGRRATLSLTWDWENRGRVPAPAE